MKIAVYCSSAEGLAAEYYTAAEQFGRLLASHGHSLVYGGYGKGVMAAVAAGVHAGGGAVTGVVPAVFDREGFAFAGCTQVIRTQTMHQRKAAMEAAIDGACDVPLRIMDACSDLLDTCEFMAHNGSKMVRSDAGCAAVLAKAAIQSASLNVFVNVACMDDKAKAARYRDLANRKVRRSSAKADAIYSFVVEQVDPADE